MCTPPKMVGKMINEAIIEGGLWEEFVSYIPLYDRVAIPLKNYFQDTFQHQSHITINSCSQIFNFLQDISLSPCSMAMWEGCCYIVMNLKIIDSHIGCLISFLPVLFCPNKGKERKIMTCPSIQNRFWKIASIFDRCVKQ